MQNLRLFTSTLLLLIFGLTLGAESFGDSTHIKACQSVVFSLLSDTETVENCGSPQPEEQQSKCTDPCHLGQSHFGHCSFVSNSNEVNLVAIDLLKLNHAFFQMFFESPNLEGPRRPPRHS